MFSSHSRPGQVSVERRTLYKQVWSIPGSQLAAQYGISDVGLAKACKRHNIPRPPRGYWAKVQAGQKLPKTPLPKPQDSRDEVVHMQGWDSPDDDTVAQLAKDAKMPTTTAKAAPPDASPPHALVQASHAQLGAAKPDADGLLSTDPAAAPVVRVAPTSVDRAMGVLDSFVKRWEARGGTLRPGVERPAAGRVPITAVGVPPDEFTFELGEVLDEDKAVTDPARRTGRLYINIGGDDGRQFRRRWHDTKSQPLERLLSQLVETLAKAVEVKRSERLDAECVVRQEKAAEVVEKAAADRESREFYWRQDLYRDVDLWHEAERVRAYLAALAKAVEAGRYVPKDPAVFDRWVAWATRLADAIDPLVAVRHAEDASPAPRNTPAVSLDVTSKLRAVLGRLAVADSDALARVTKKRVEEACGGSGYGRAWNEVTRVLLGLGYDVSKRPEVSDWM